MLDIENHSNEHYFLPLEYYWSKPGIVLLDKSGVEIRKVQRKSFKFSEFTLNNSRFGSSTPICDIFVILAFY